MEINLMKDGKIQKNVSLKNLTTLKIGGKAKYYLEVNSEDGLLNANEFAKKNKLPIFILGGGSDILVNDKGFKGLVVKYLDTSLSFSTKNNQALVSVAGGMIWDDLVKQCVKENLQGVECLSGIPGTVGAAPVQNIGAYGQELKDTFVSLIAFDLKRNKFVRLSKADCKFEYRDSLFKSKKYWQRFLITRVILKLKKNVKPKITYKSLANYIGEKKISNPSLQEVRKAVLAVRSTKFEDYNELPNAGSFFKNPIITIKKLKKLQEKYPSILYFEYRKDKYKLFAGWLIENSSWKGKKLGNAKVSDKHALILLNPEAKAKASEISELANRISKDVEKKFEIRLEKEVQFIGF